MNYLTHEIYGSMLGRFIPESNLPDPDLSWLKRRKWYWCDEEEYKAWRKDLRKRKKTRFSVRKKSLRGLPVSWAWERLIMTFLEPFPSPGEDSIIVISPLFNCDNPIIGSTDPRRGFFVLLNTNASLVPAQRDVVRNFELRKKR